MKKVIGIVIAAIIILPVLTCAIGYAYLSYRYQDNFMPGLSINNVYAADMTIEQVNTKLKEDFIVPDVTITDKDGKFYTFSMSEAGYDENYTDDLKQIKSQQTVMKLVSRVTDSDAEADTRELTAKITYDEGKLIDYLDELDFIKDNTAMAGKKIEIKKDRAQGYYLVDETVDMLNHEKARNAIVRNIADGNYEIDLVKEGCYDQPTNYTPSQDYALKMWNKLKPYMNSEITYVFSDSKYVLNGAKIADWIKVKDNGQFELDEFDNLVIDEEAVTEFVKEFCDKYSTVNKPRTFKSHTGDMVTIEKGTYGSKIDYKPELEYLLNQLPRGTQTMREPEYVQKPFSGLTGLNDIGNTYIEVDMSEQHLYYYVKGTLKLDSDVVTGCTGLGRGTPERVCYVYFKQRNRTLHGEDYDTFVNYWMAVYNNIGIHDANWRGKFGGTIYKSAGSHGCVNTPIAKVKELYDMVEVGTPVLLHY